MRHIIVLACVIIACILALHALGIKEPYAEAVQNTQGVGAITFDTVFGETVSGNKSMFDTTQVKQLDATYAATGEIMVKDRLCLGDQCIDKSIMGKLIQNQGRGEIGPAGPVGPIGPTGPKGVGIADIVLQGGNMLIKSTDGKSFGLPMPTPAAGPKGAPGAAGAKGAPGPSGPSGPAGLGLNDVASIETGVNKLIVRYNNKDIKPLELSLANVKYIAAIDYDKGSNSLVLKYSNGEPKTIALPTQTADGKVIAGPSGPPGPAGQNGAPGKEGPPGPPGPPGKDGAAASGITSAAILPGSIVNVWFATTDKPMSTKALKEWKDTNLSITVTPKYASSKLYIEASSMIETITNDQMWAGHRLLRDNDVLVTNDGVGTLWINAHIGQSSKDHLTFMVDAKNTNSTTFKTQVQVANYKGSYGGTVYVHQNNTGNITPGTITVFEVYQGPPLAAPSNIQIAKSDKLCAGDTCIDEAGLKRLLSVSPRGHINVVHRRPVWGIGAAFANKKFTGTSPQKMLNTLVYGPFGYALPPVAVGATRKYRMYAVYSDSMTAGSGPIIRFSILNGKWEEQNKFVNFQFGLTWGGLSGEMRDAYSNILDDPKDGMHAYMYTYVPADAQGERSVVWQYAEIQALDVYP